MKKLNVHLLLDILLVVMALAAVLLVLVGMIYSCSATVDAPIEPEPTFTEYIEEPVEVIETIEPVHIPTGIYKQIIFEDMDEVASVKYFDVPLSEELQDHIFAVCEEYRIEPSIVIAMIERESGFRDWVVGDGGKSFGLMQIQERWHLERMERLGVTDLLDPYQNVLVGIDILAELFGRYDDIEWVLMAYNGGASYANNLAERGVVSAYATGVIEGARELRSEANA
jgi:hypothetical protein